ncbi:4'-phosphopantetheinyl transferase family protein [Humidesulfovibrio idahonensis]
MDQAEAKRAAAFVREVDRRRFVLAHAALRIILAAQTKTTPARIAYRFNAHGKPSLVQGGSEFNLSHAGDWILVAVSVSGPVGIDVEPLRVLPDADALVERFFAPEERSAYLACSEPDRARAFFTLWTRKEAYAKALGQGLGLGFDAFAVGLDSPARVLRPHVSSPDLDLWDIPAPKGYVGALAGKTDGIAVYELSP